MKVFISWSGSLSQKIAVIIREWLPFVIPGIKPYVSSEDIDKGVRWSQDISSELELSSYGILCLTKENIESPWIHFEAGAISKVVGRSHVSPILFDVKRSEIKGPLVQFQSTMFDKYDFLKLVSSLNDLYKTEASYDSNQLEQAFEVWWTKLEKSITKELANSLSETCVNDVNQENDMNMDEKEYIEELLELVRSQQKILSDPEHILPRNYLKSIMSENNFLLPPDHEVWDHLEAGLIKIGQMYTNITNKREIAVEDIVKLLSYIRPPINYIIQKRKEANLIGLKEDFDH